MAILVQWKQVPPHQLGRGPDLLVVSIIINRLQESATIEEYATNMHGLFNMQFSLVNVGGKIALCLLRIHPIHWTVFGNRPSLEEREWMPL